jgi:MFS family permease
MICPGPGPCRGPIGEQLRAGFLGAIPGLALGLTTGALTSARAPRYGRVALIQSAALGGAITGALAQLGAQWHPYGSGWDYSVRTVTPDTKTEVEKAGYKCPLDPTSTAETPLYQCPYKATSVLDLMPGALIGLNVGLVAGLLGAYLPDQSKYGPTWRRILLIDLAAAAGAVAGGVGGCVADVNGCLNTNPDDQARGSAALAAIGGTVVGLVGGILLTRHFDDDPNAAPAPADKPSVTVSTTLLPLRAPDGSMTPAIGAFGTF